MTFQPLLLLALLVLTGCGTLMGSREIVSIDSVPRGLTVYLPASESQTNERERLGTTPLYLDVERAYSRELEFEDGRSKRKTDVHQTCSARWLESIQAADASGRWPS